MDKTQAYCDLLKLFGKMLNPQERKKVNKSPQAKKKLGVEMGLVGMNIALLGSDKVVNALIDWRAAALAGETERIVRKFGTLMVYMRQDLQDTKITSQNTMLDCFITEA